MVKPWLAAALLSLPGAALAASAADEMAYDAKAQAIVDGFTTAEVIGQMTQLDISLVINPKDNTLNEDYVRVYAQQYVGSYLNTIWDEPMEEKFGWTASEFRAIVTRIQEITMEENGGHPMIYGIDSVHGANYVEGAVIFPHQINSGASFNPDLVYEVGRITARDTQAAGIPWIFGPILEIAQNPLWSRTHETFGEDPYMTSVMADAIVRGLQSYNQSAACMKHFIGYSKTPTGHDRDNVIMADYDLLNYFLPPFKAAMEAGAMSTMENYISINGDPVISSPRILKDLLRSDLGFDGVLLSDWNEVNNLKDWHRIVSTYEEAVALSLKETSLDMSMVPNDTKFIDYATNMLKTYPENEARLRESAKRIIKMKLKLGLYDNPVPGAQFEFMVGNDDDKATALNMARESIVLLKNAEDVLPLPKGASVFLTGHSANNVGYQCSGWSKSWQGYSGNKMYPNGVSVRQGFENLVGNDSFTYFNGLLANGSISDEELAMAVELASQHEYTVAVIGESQYTEKPGDIDNLELPEGQVKFIEALRATGTKMIVVLFEGRPRLLGSIPDNSMAIIDGMLPCELGGQAMAEILYGEVNPSGRLPITYPKDSGNIAIPYNHRVTTRCAYDNCWPQWEFGSGLSYTQFNYSAVTLDTTTITSADSTLTATVTITNVGDRAGKETVMLFVIQPFRKISVPEIKQLKKFKKIELEAGASMDVSFTLTTDDLSVYDPQIGKGLKRVFEDSDYVVAVGPWTWCDVYNNITNPLCAEFSIDTSSGAGTVNVALPLSTLASGSGSGSGSIDAQAQTIVNDFSTDQVIGQMCQLDISMVLKDDKSVNETAVRQYAKMGVGSYLNLPFAGWNATEWRERITLIQKYHMDENKGHPMVYGLDSVHGAQYVDQAVMFPHQLNVGASFNTDLAFKMGRITGRDTAAAGISWVLGPILDIAYNPLWTRTFETFGEDPYLTSVLGAAHIQGLQNNSQIGSCMKHFIGYSQTNTGVDREGVTISDFDLLNYHMPSFKAGIDHGAVSTMENYISINGEPVVSSTKVLNSLLRDDLDFDGVVATDWGEVSNLQTWHRVTREQQDAVELVIANTSLDISMGPFTTDFIDQAKIVLENNPDYEDRLRLSAKRIIKMKLEMGLYDTPVPGEDYVDLVGNDDDVEAALDLARESIVLLKNDDDTLPLKNGSSIFLTGFSADDVGMQCGGWSIYWQGTSGNDVFPHGVSVKEGLENLADNDSVTYFNGLNSDGTYSDEDLATAVEYATQADYVIAAIGEAPYAEKWGDINELALPSGQIKYVQALADAGAKIILVLFEGRPRLLGSLPYSVKAVVHGGLACELGGQAMAEILYGQVNPSGKLPITYPKDSGHIMIPYRHRVNTQCSYGNCEMQWDFGTGLSYTSFTYSDLTLSTTEVTSNDDTLSVSVTVKNDGTVTGKETVMLFMIQPYRAISVPEVKMLRKFEKIELEAGASKTVMFTLTADDWSVYKPQIGSGLKRIAENGEFVVAIKPDTDCDVYNDNGFTDSLCANFTLTAPTSTVSDSTSSSTSLVGMAWWATILSIAVSLIL
ncbi:hypothetical protein BBP00_00002663 [Phytophthora kernoviae]|uniref:beta-glucosidase n=1 Tax=Phytophthora kernoviae TaxID=325452 RepID=A0A3F2RWM3_9STRA|nr:hypothetical protein BBP00_00002663 [Phytophthora kernoviae]